MLCVCSSYDVKLVLLALFHVSDWKVGKKKRLGKRGGLLFLMTSVFCLIIILFFSFSVHEKGIVLCSFHICRFD